MWLGLEIEEKQLNMGIDVANDQRGLLQTRNNFDINWKSSFESLERVNSHDVFESNYVFILYTLTFRLSVSGRTLIEQDQICN